LHCLPPLGYLNIFNVINYLTLIIVFVKHFKYAGLGSGHSKVLIFNNKRCIFSNEFQAPVKSAPISDHQQSWRYEDGPWKGPGHLCWWPLIFKKNFLISVLSDLSVLVTTRPIHHLQVSCLPRPALLVVVLLAHTNRLLKTCKNSFLFQFISRRHQSDLHLSSMPSR
jgi:hypothetical protein